MSDACAVLGPARCRCGAAAAAGTRGGGAAHEGAGSAGDATGVKAAALGADARGSGVLAATAAAAVAAGCTARAAAGEGSAAGKGAGAEKLTAGEGLCDGVRAGRAGAPVLRRTTSVSPLPRPSTDSCADAGSAGSCAAGACPGQARCVRLTGTAASYRARPSLGCGALLLSNLSAATLTPAKI